MLRAYSETDAKYLLCPMKMSSTIMMNVTCEGRACMVWVEMENDNGIANLERRIRTVGNQTRWWGAVVLIVGVIMAIVGVSGGVVITAMGIVVTLQGAIIQYAFR